RVVDSWRSTATLDQFLKQQDIPGISGVDTRAIAQKLRRSGAMKAQLVDDVPTQMSWQKSAPFALAIKAQTQPYMIPGEGYRIVVINYGTKQSILRELIKRNCNIVVVPA